VLEGEPALLSEGQVANIDYTLPFSDALYPNVCLQAIKPQMTGIESSMLSRLAEQVIAQSSVAHHG